jgi:hypothetical protein
MGRWQPHHHMPPYSDMREMLAYAKGYWNGFADNPTDTDTTP